jgi:RND family efflux transporter MFP subunit
MKALRVILLVLIVAAIAGGAGFWFGREHGESKEVSTDTGDESKEPATSEPSAEDVVASVEVAPLRSGRISETATVFGTIVAEASDVRIQSVPFESLVKHVDVTAAQEVAPQSKTVLVEASPDTLLALSEAKNALDAAARDLAQTQQRVIDRLATNQELSQAQQALDAAKLKHQSLIDRGVGKQHQLVADVSGIVNKIDVQEGQIVPAGGPLVEIAAGNRIEAKLGVNEETVSRLKIDQPVRLRRVDQPADSAIEGKIRLIGRRVDATARLVEVRVSLPTGAKFLLDSAIVGEIELASENGLIVPRNAALPDESGQYVIFTVKDDHAVKHAVQLGLQQSGEVQINAKDLQAGDPVVVVGNYQLQDGMKVEVKPATASATTQAGKED